MSILKLEMDIDSIEDIYALRKALNKFDARTIIRIPIVEFKYIFNQYLMDNLDIDLFEYDVAIAETTSTISIDMSYMKEENEHEYEYIIKELRSHFGKSIIKIEEDYESAIGTINIKAALRMIFSGAAEIKIINDSIKIKIDLEEVDDELIEKYFLD